MPRPSESCEAGPSASPPSTHETPAREQFVQAGGVRARVLEQGEGPAVLLIHGLGGWAELWRETMGSLAAAGFRAIACDLPGFGQSQPPPAPVRYLDGETPYYAQFIGQLLDALGLPSAHLVGHSLGGGAAAVAAICLPQRVGRLVLVAPGGLGVRVAPRLRAAGLPLARQLARLVPDAVLRDFVRANFHDPARVHESLYQDARRYGRAAEAHRVLSQLLTVRGPRLALLRALLQGARGIRSPTLVVWGREDRILPLPSPDLLAVVPGSRSEIIPEAGHLVMLEQPESFNAALRRFLRPWPEASHSMEMNGSVATSSSASNGTP